MKILLMLTSAAIIQAAVIENKDQEDIKCDGVVIDNVYHDIEILKTDIDRPYLLAVDYSTNTVYFSYSLNKDDDVFKTAYVNLNTKEYADLQGISNGFAQTVDQKNHEIYIGGSDGLYKYNHITKTGERIGAKDNDIWIIYFKDILYYSTFPDQFLYTFINGESSRFKDLENTKVDQFVIDNEDIMFFTNGTGLFGQKKGTQAAVLYKASSEGIRGLTTDINGNVFVCTVNGIFKIDKSTVSVEKVVDIDDAFGLAFDNENNIVYSDATNLVRLKPNKSKTCEIS
ncbi:ommochrome-binding protein-like [Maniola hyperantus]|uniref:ommochrome-binding protein-like n=1 Tax=Aphantopus hyperantus TaxID=2795564 RepID=UPI001568A0C1|nr:ommochrome-binding protein-like [Maniola hyperantus]